MSKMTRNSRTDLTAAGNVLLVAPGQVVRLWQQLRPAAPWRRVIDRGQSRVSHCPLPVDYATRQRRRRLTMCLSYTVSRTCLWIKCETWQPLVDNWHASWQSLLFVLLWQFKCPAYHFIVLGNCILCSTVYFSRYSSRKLCNNCNNSEGLHLHLHLFRSKTITMQ